MWQRALCSLWQTIISAINSKTKVDLCDAQFHLIQDSSRNSFALPPRTSFCSSLLPQKWTPLLRALLSTPNPPRCRRSCLCPIKANPTRNSVSTKNANLSEVQSKLKWTVSSAVFESAFNMKMRSYVGAHLQQRMITIWISPWMIRVEEGCKRHWRSKVVRHTRHRS